MHSQQRLTKGKSYLTNLISSYNKVTLADEGKVVDVARDFNKAFEAVLHNILSDKLSSCGMSRFAVHCVKNWLNIRAHSECCSE